MNPDTTGAIHQLLLLKSMKHLKAGRANYDKISDFMASKINIYMDTLVVRIGELRQHFNDAEIRGFLHYARVNFEDPIWKWSAPAASQENDPKWMRDNEKDLLFDKHAGLVFYFYIRKPDYHRLHMDRADNITIEEFEKLQQALWRGNEKELDPEIAGQLEERSRGLHEPEIRLNSWVMWDKDDWACLAIAVREDGHVLSVGFDWEYNYPLIFKVKHASERLDYQPELDDQTHQGPTVLESFKQTAINREMWNPDAEAKFQDALILAETWKNSKELLLGVNDEGEFYAFSDLKKAIAHGTAISAKSKSSLSDLEEILERFNKKPPFNSGKMTELRELIRDFDLATIDPELSKRAAEMQGGTRDSRIKAAEAFWRMAWALIFQERK